MLQYVHPHMCVYVCVYMCVCYNISIKLLLWHMHGL